MPIINFQKIWHDPVGSKVIAGFILGPIGFFSYAYWPTVKDILSHIRQINFLTTTMPNWLIISSFLIIVGFITFRLKDLNKNTNFVPTQNSTSCQTLPLTDFPEPQVKYTGKKFVSLPKVQLTSQQQVWINHVYQNYLKGTNIPAHVMKMQLVSAHQIPKDFDYKSISETLLRANDNTITLYGIYNVNQATDIPEKLDVIIHYIRQLISYNPSNTYISIVSLTQKLDISERDISTALLLGKECNGMSWMTASYGSNKDPQHYLHLINSFSVNNEHSFQFYSEYENIEASLKNALSTR